MGDPSGETRGGRGGSCKIPARGKWVRLKKVARVREIVILSRLQAAKNLAAPRPHSEILRYAQNDIGESGCRRAAE
jgi:hypothetical protein